MLKVPFYVRHIIVSGLITALILSSIPALRAELPPLIPRSIIFEESERGKDVTYLLFPDAGHMGGGVPINLLRRWAAIEAFLGKHLGGRVEAPSDYEKWESLLK